MKKRIIIFPYKIASEGARSLAKELETRCIYPDRKYKQFPNHIIVNWGSSVFPRWWNRAYERNVLNLPSFVGSASNKLRALQAMQQVGVRVPQFTQLRSEALDWQRDGKIIVARTLLTGHEGRGIVLAKETSDPVPAAPLYTAHIRHRREFRIHVVGNTVIDMAEKRKRNNFDDSLRNSLVRNFRFGWVFTRGGIEVPEDVKTQAVMAVQALQLHFGAVDVGYREKEGQAYVFEVNTAPGIEGTTISRYADAIRQIVA